MNAANLPNKVSQERKKERKRITSQKEELIKREAEWLKEVVMVPP